ncbi:hypothetical protein FB554_2175 [Barrientosiimonas humi]|uniref:Uncharacterized protein n=1 Tax=Barrientosiimonas humi TaxID=999931 RepID=A0A542XDX0_9MICO|nr:hypothetical protein [Barrientosiimonas humi]TQL34018.1 hypothetical protein FB554_2175 [Barrientosiimonas humi]CAG7574008.1 hypothetical protein BH39T_PBIAJDOK_02650 [Barrientosiimonas humi]
MSRRAWIALITVLALLAGFGVWRWSTSAAFRAERAADALADLAGVQSARTMERGGERHILAQLAPGASSDQTRAVISRASQLSADDVVRRVLVRVGSAEIYVGGYLPDDATETLLALAALPTGRATMISGSDVTVAPTDRTPLQTAIDSLRLVLDRRLRVDAVQVQGRNDDGKPYRQVRIEDPARSQLTMLQQLLPGQGQIRELEIGGEKRLEVEARTDRAGLAPVAQTVRRAATAADPVPRWVHVRTRGGEFQLNGSGDPAPALAAADDLERDGLPVDRISTDRAFVQVGGRWTGDRADLLPVAERAIRALDPPLPPGASISASGAFLGTLDDLRTVGPVISRAQESGGSVAWRNATSGSGPQSTPGTLPRLTVALPEGECLGPDGAALAPAMTTARSAAWRGTARVVFLEQSRPESPCTDDGRRYRTVELESTSGGRSAKVVEDGGLGAGEVVRRWSASAPAA